MRWSQTDCQTVFNRNCSDRAEIPDGQGQGMPQGPDQLGQAGEDEDH